jgi:citrate synthase
MADFITTDLSSTQEIARISKDRALLSIENHDFDLPVVKATVGPDGVLVSSMKNEGFVTLDPGFLTTAQCESKITFIDGDKSILRYRGYDIMDLTKNAWYLEVAYLLIYGYLPNNEQLANFEDPILKNTVVGEDFHAFMNGFPRNAHPVTMLASSINALESFLPGTSDVDDPEQVTIATSNILAKMRTIASLVMRRHRNQALLYPNTADGFITDFLRLCFAKPYEQYDPDPVLIDALDKLLIIQADHEQNCSTSVVRVVGSANASLYASVAAGINALSGPLHGGANEAAYRQLLQIQQHIKDHGTSVQDFVNWSKSSNTKIMGLGHRVYKSYDPRAQIAKESAIRILQKGVGDLELLKIALELENTVLADDFFVERKLYPNLDFWTCLVYHAIGFDPEMFTVLFALARSAGWIAHWKEMHRDPLTKIGRPRQVYSGPVYREWVDISKR